MFSIWTLELFFSLRRELERKPVSDIALDAYIDPSHLIRRPQEPGVKADGGKAAFELIPPHIEEEVAQVLAFGARKYSPDNWRKVPGAKRRYFGAFRRHMNAHKKGELRDPESGFLHITHAIVSLMFLGEFELASIPEIPE